MRIIGIGMYSHIPRRHFCLHRRIGVIQNAITAQAEAVRKQVDPDAPRKPKPSHFKPIVIPPTRGEASGDPDPEDKIPPYFRLRQRKDVQEDDHPPPSDGGHLDIEA